MCMKEAKLCLKLLLSTWYIASYPYNKTANMVYMLHILTIDLKEKNLTELLAFLKNACLIILDLQNTQTLWGCKLLKDHRIRGEQAILKR